MCDKLWSGCVRQRHGKARPEHVNKLLVFIVSELDRRFHARTVRKPVSFMRLLPHHRKILVRKIRQSVTNNVTNAFAKVLSVLLVTSMVTRGAFV